MRLNKAFPFKNAIAIRLEPKQNKDAGSRKSVNIFKNINKKKLNKQNVMVRTVHL